MKNYLLVLFFLYSFPALALDLTNKSTLIGDVINPVNPFLKCAAQTAVLTAYGDAKEILAYAYSEPVGNARPPKYASVRFATKNKLNEKREGVALELQSTDAEKGWQFVQNSDGEIFLFSTLVSSNAVLKDDKGNLITSFDISNCQ